MSDIGVRESTGSAPQSSVEVVGVAGRRRFTADYKRRILDEVGRAGNGINWLFAWSFFVVRRAGLPTLYLKK